MDQGIGTNHGDFVVAGTTEDYYNSTNDPDLVAGDEYDALLVATHDCDPSATISNSACFNNTAAYNTPNDVWRRNTHASNEDGLCVFDIKRTADDGFVICGNNDNQGDDFTVIKFAPTLAPQTNYDVSPGIYTLTANETWTTNKTLAVKVVIPSGYTLTIDGATISFASSDHIFDYSEFSPGTGAIPMGIVVAAGGHLILENGATLQGLNSCGKRLMWDGIKVLGDPTSAQSITYQGEVDISTGVHINDARYGIIAGDPIRNFIITPANYTGLASYTLGGAFNGYSGTLTSDIITSNCTTNNHGGAILSIDNANFLNCLNSIHMMPYPQTNISTVTNSTFGSDANGLADICNYADANGNVVPSAIHIFGIQVDGLTIQDNTFTCDNGFIRAERPKGISLINSGMLATWTPSSGPGNAFNNLLKGVESFSGAGVNSLNLRISHNTFTNNGIGIDVAGNIDAMEIGANTFNVPGCKITSTSSSGDDFFPNPWAGVRLAGCRGYDASLNTFNGYSGSTGGLMFANGIIVNGGHTYYDIKVYQNTFNDMHFGAVALGINTNNGSYSAGLQFKCNDFTGYSLNDISRISQFQNYNSTSAATLRNPQGDCIANTLSPIYYLSPAGNRFQHSCSSYTYPWLYGGTEYLYADNNVTEEVDYHNNESSTDYDPNSCIVSTVSSNIVYVNTSCLTSPSSHSVACPDGYSYTPYSHLMHDGLNTLDVTLSSMSTDDPNYPGTVATHDDLISANARNYSFAGYPDSAGILLESYGWYEDAFPFYIRSGNFTAASRVYTYFSTATADQLLYKYLAGLALDLYSDGNTWLQIDSTHLDSLKRITQLNRAPGYMAGAITQEHNVRLLDWPIPAYDSALYVYDSSLLTDTGSHRGASVTHNTNSANIPGVNPTTAPIRSFSVYPNPSSGSFSADASADGLLYLCNALGQQIQVYNIIAGKNVLLLPAGLSSGIYTGRYKPANGGRVSIMKITYNP